MRPGAGFDVTAAPAPATAVAGGRGGCHSAWHCSPVPYLFLGLAAMVGLIGFALLVLAFSYWKISGFLEGAGDREGGGEEDTCAAKAGAPDAAEHEEQVVVIMAGDEKPTYLATPMMSRPACAFGDRRCSNDAVGDRGDEEEEESKVDGNKTTQRKEQKNQTN